MTVWPMKEAWEGQGKVSSSVCDAGDHSMQGELPAGTDWGWEGGKYKLRLFFFPPPPPREGLS